MNEDKRIESILDEILAQHIELNKKLFELIKNERHCLIHNKLDALDEVNNEKLALRCEIAEVEKKRMMHITDFVKKYGLSKAHVRLEDIICVVPEPYKSSYKMKRDLLRNLLKKIKILHDGNKIFIQRSLNFQERAFMLLFGFTQQKVQYGARGEVQHNKKPLFDSVA